MTKILLTGVTGFIGSNLFKKKIFNEALSIGRTRPASCKNFKYAPLDGSYDYTKLLHNIEVVVHMAGKSKIMNKTSMKSLCDYRKVNTFATLNLARQAADCGVKRFVFLSSVKVNGESTSKLGGNIIFSNNDVPDPQNDYAISKFEAEKGLWDIATETGLEIVILRLPLVYGHGVKGSLKRLIGLMKYGIPLPFSSLKNQRSMIGIDNLISLIIRCIKNPEAAGKTFLVSDCEDLSTPDLLKHIAFAMDRSPRLFPFPTLLLKFLGYVIGRSSEIDRLTGSLQVDTEYTRKILNWTPPVSIREGIKRMIKSK